MPPSPPLQPLNAFVTPMLTDLYQVTMAYAYWNAGHHDDYAVFDLFFRKNPFQGEYTVFAGLEECLRHLSAFKFTNDDIDYLRQYNPNFKPAFFDYLLSLDASAVKVYAVDEGSVVFPRVPLLRVEGPLALVQLLETTFLVLVNFASLVTTNAARHRYMVGDQTKLLEFGLRRAQGPDGAISASRYSVMGGFDATSNVLAAKMFGIPCKGTHAHSFVSSFSSLGDLSTTTLQNTEGKECEFVAVAKEFREQLCPMSNIGEFAAFIAYAQAFPSDFLALIDTYSTLDSGIWNFLAVSLALIQLGYEPVGIRLDSGDLAYFSKMCRKFINETGARFDLDLSSISIFASNDINEDVLHALGREGHAIDAFGIGTHLVTCQKQPALGCVFKLVEVNKKPRIKVSQEIEKVTIPGCKIAYRLFNEAGVPMLDLMARTSETAPSVGRRIRATHPIVEKKRVDVIPSRVETLHKLVWADGKVQIVLPTLTQLRERVRMQVGSIREDHKRYLNPTPYKVSITENLFRFMHSLWLNETPVRVIR